MQGRDSVSRPCGTLFSSFPAVLSLIHISPPPLPASAGMPQSVPRPHSLHQRPVAPQGSRTPLSVLARVDLPDPLWPSTTTKEPCPNDECLHHITLSKG